MGQSAVFLDWLLRKLFGKQEGEKVYNSIGVLGGLIALVITVATHRWWLAAGAGVIVILSALDLLRERRQPLTRPTTMDWSARSARKCRTRRV